MPFTGFHICWNRVSLIFNCSFDVYKIVKRICISHLMYFYFPSLMKCNFCTFQSAMYTLDRGIKSFLGYEIFLNVFSLGYRDQFI